jgi:hypothetical protein
LLHLLRKRFGELPEQVGTRLRGASLEQIDSWLERLLAAASVEEVLQAVSS